MTIWRETRGMVSKHIANRIIETGAVVTFDVLAMPRRDVPAHRLTPNRSAPPLPSNIRLLYRVRVRPKNAVRIERGDYVVRRADLPGWGGSESRVAKVLTTRNEYGGFTLRPEGSHRTFTALPWTVLKQETN